MSMSLDDAIAATQRFAALFEAVQVIAEQIKEVRLLEQLTREATAQRDAMASEVEAGKSALASINADVEAAKKKHKEAQSKAFDTAAAADAKARSILADADARANVIINKAKADADNLLAGARADLAAKRDELDGLLKEIGDHELELAGKRADKDALDRSITEARALIATMMGAK